MHQDVYRDQNRDFAFEATDQQLEGFLVENKVRLPSGYKYWTRGDDQELYCREAAQAQARVDAQAFVRKYEEKLSMASHALESEDVSIVCAFYAKDFGQLWHEGMYWLEQVIRLVAESQELELAQCYDMLDHKKDLQQVHPRRTSGCRCSVFGTQWRDQRSHSFVFAKAIRLRSHPDACRDSGASHIQ